VHSEARRDGKRDGSATPRGKRGPGSAQARAPSPGRYGAPEVRPHGDEPAGGLCQLRLRLQGQDDERVRAARPGAGAGGRGSRFPAAGTVARPRGASRDGGDCGAREATEDARVGVRGRNRGGPRAAARPPLRGLGVVRPAIPI
ncbi:hypothetical protein M885DRAFT_621375, partial [Pelagophyceae sp. CCMP2097]